VDYNNNQLYAHIFDANDNKEEIALKKEIRFPIGSGIAGYVAKTGEPLNIPDAYEDYRFNRSIDQKTGYLKIGCNDCAPEMAFFETKLTLH